MYEPNFNDSRVKARITTAIDWIEQFVTNKPNWLSTREIDRHFGQGQLPLSKWLRNKLLIESDSYYNYQTGRCKTYTRNYDGWLELKQQLNGKKISTTITPQQQQQLSSGIFTYEEKSNRWFNTLQNLPKRVKRSTFAQAGFNYNYDIICAAPRLIVQYARRCGFDSTCPLLDAYINDATSIRTQIAQEIGLTPKQVKFVVNAILHGAHITHKADSSILLELGSRHLLIDNLKQNLLINQLKEEIKEVWASIKPHRTSRTIINKNNKIIKLPLSSKEKSEIYRELEKEVLTSIEKYLKKKSNFYFKEHDGWMCKQVIDEIELRSYVKSKTGYSIDLTCEIYE
jgi:hypothetical protein